MTGTADAPNPGHVSSRPGWLCAVDGDDWPCPRARTELAQQFDGDDGALAAYLTGELFAAAGDLYGTAKGEPRLLACRFLFWAGGPTTTELTLNPTTRQPRVPSRRYQDFRTT
jgi:hypothetical protein